MSVIMTLRMQGDAAALERIAAEDPDRIRSISQHGKEAGVIGHRFYANDDGEIMVVDEWPDAESFQRFFEEQSGAIQPLMAEVGATAPPEIKFWRKLETGDDIGWES
jgi:heme-degrading monooxygenase HmoA